ncbi:MAG: phthalate 4,5-dioxygenase [Candidatus Entotheonella gemina]|uniref:Phthalate 4,5-dioxygenase n=1 Tax=Candidatus Entotheonella gemina TaxID=1429439 RepID=W4LJ52_9BACT|nr:MAG: phthalate 4,5-dioxygenase [Candidatus Entotheonella gemina]
MLSEDQNRVLTQVGAGTLMGDLMRRYWMPIAAVAELDENPIKLVRLMGENLVLYKDKSGTYGLVDRHCPHRRADMSYGILEDCGLRCNYHGWLFDETGACLAQPFEEIAHPTARFKDRITIKAYPIEAKVGLLWAYLGPQPAPLVPDWDLYSEPGYKQIIFAYVPCNWFQCQENSIDPVHFEWLHSNWSQVLKGESEPTYAPTHLKLGFDEFEYGFVYRRVRADTDEDNDLWTVGRVCLWPNALYTTFFEWRVPIDDENTLSVAWFNNPVPGEAPFEQTCIPYWTAPIKDPETGRWISTHIMNQDFIAWVGQGTIADRTQEHLGESDRGVILMRKRMLEEAQIVANGGEPKAVIRDPEQNRKLYLPRVERALRNQMAHGQTRAPRNQHLAGQPQVILDEMDRIWAERAQDSTRDSSIRT